MLLAVRVIVYKDNGNSLVLGKTLFVVLVVRLLPEYHTGHIKTLPPYKRFRLNTKIYFLVTLFQLNS